MPIQAKTKCCRTPVWMITGGNGDLPFIDWRADEPACATCAVPVPTTCGNLWTSEKCEHGQVTRVLALCERHNEEAIDVYHHYIHEDEPLITCGNCGIDTRARRKFIYDYSLCIELCLRCYHAAREDERERGKIYHLDCGMVPEDRGSVTLLGMLTGGDKMVDDICGRPGGAKALQETKDAGMVDVSDDGVIKINEKGTASVEHIMRRHR